MAIELKKGIKLSLEKAPNNAFDNAFGEILVNLKWNQGKDGIDLDLGCLYELKDGSIGAVQALGKSSKSFGNFKAPPFILLDGDDRTGESAEGETLRINGDKVSQIKRILVFTYIYDGAVNWKQTKGVVTIKYKGSQDIIIRMDEYGSKQTMCGIALFENRNDETFTVEKVVKFFGDHMKLDKAYGWGIKWVPGEKK